MYAWKRRSFRAFGYARCYSFGVQLAPSPRPQRVSRAGLIILVYGGLGGIALIWGAVRGNVNIYLAPGTVANLPRMALSPAVGLAVGLVLVFLSRYATHRL